MSTKNQDFTKYPQSKRTGRFRQENSGNRWNMKAAFRVECSRIFRINGEFHFAANSNLVKCFLNLNKEIEDISGIVV